MPPVQKLHEQGAPPVRRVCRFRSSHSPDRHVRARSVVVLHQRRTETRAVRRSVSGNKQKINQSNHIFIKFILFQVVCSYDETFSSYNCYHGPQTARWFLQEMKRVAGVIEEQFKDVKPLTMTPEDERRFREATSCHICDRPLQEEDRVRDHCHLSGNFRGAAHNACNINYKLPTYVPVFFHNLSGYDAHLFVKELGTDEEEIRLIASTDERYISFSKKVGNLMLRFLDSYRFMGSSLEKLASYMNKDDMTFVRKHFPDQVEFDLLTRKGVFPYDYVNDWTRLDETSLPSRESFYSKLMDAGILDTDYAHAQKVWDVFEIKNLCEYMMLYLRTDVLLLADIFEQFRNVCLKAYGLDPVRYYTSPGLTWDACLKVTGIRLELLTDPDMLLFFERALRGGISQCCNRYAKANNRYMTDDPTKQETFLMYFDACNLYGWAMSQMLPVDSFRWLSEKEIAQLDVHSIPKDSSEGYVLECDLEYPQSLHDKNKDLPFACEHLAPPGSKLKKLMTTLYNKQKYVIHYRNLQQCLEQGLILKKIHRVVQFRQEAWLKQYIDLNTNMRKLAKNEFEKNFFKLMNNAVFGKSMENIRKRRDIKLVSKWGGRGGARKLIAKPNFHRSKIFTETLVSIELKRLQILFDKPIYIGMVILDLSK